MIEVYISKDGFLLPYVLYFKGNYFQWSHNLNKKEWIYLHNKNELTLYIKLFEIGDESEININL